MPLWLPPASAREHSMTRLVASHLDSRQQPGFIVDYDLYQNQTNFTFQSDTTYFIRGSVNLSGTTVLEGGTVLKFTNSLSSGILISGPISCRTDRYRPAIF